MRKKIRNILIVICIICVAVILQIIFQFFTIRPLEWGENKIYQINDCLIGICTSIITGILIYFLTVPLADSFYKKKAKPISKPYIQDLYYCLQRSQAYLVYKKNTQGDNYTNFTQLENSQKFTIEERRDAGSQTTQTYTELQLWHEEQELVYRNIDAILAIPYRAVIDEELHMNLCQLRYSLFYIGVNENFQNKNVWTQIETIKNHGNYQWQNFLNFTRPNFGKELEEYSQTIKELLDIIPKVYQDINKRHYKIV